MAKLIYFTPVSLDGFIGDGEFDWSPPDEEVFGFINDTLRPMGTYLYGRREYETMAVWETPEVIPGPAEAVAEFGRIWRAAEKVVYSRTLEKVWTARTRLEREFDAEMVRGWKAAAVSDLGVAGPTLAGEAIRAGLVDEYQLLVAPVMLGGGIRVLPGGMRLGLALLEERRFGNGTVFLRYGVRE